MDCCIRAYKRIKRKNREISCAQYGFVPRLFNYTCMWIQIEKNSMTIKDLIDVEEIRKAQEMVDIDNEFEVDG